MKRVLALLLFLLTSASDAAQLGGSTGSPGGVPGGFFGLSILDSTETNYSGAPAEWPMWAVPSFRAIDNYGPVGPNNTYSESLSIWSSVELAATYTIAAPAVFAIVPAPSGQLYTNGQRVQLEGSVPGGFTAGTDYCIVGVSGLNFSLATWPGCGTGKTSTGSAGTCQIYDWNLFDAVWANLKKEGVIDVLMSFEGIPQWASVGNAYSFSATIPTGTPGVVTAAGNNYANGWHVFLTGGTLPTGLTANTTYVILNYNTPGAGKFNLATVLAPATALNTTCGTTCTTTITAQDSPPTSTGTITTWVTSYLTRAALDGLPIKYVEGPNEPSDGIGFYVGTIAELVTIQQTVYNAAKAYDPTIQVVSAPVQGLGVGGTQAPGTPNGGITYLAAFLAAGGGAYADIIGFHGYPPDPGTYSPVTYSTDLASLVATIAANGAGGKPLWNTEYSSVSATASVDEAYLARTTFIDLDQGIGRKYYYSWEGTNSSFLWINPTNSPPTGALNVAGVAYQTLVRWLTGATFTSRISTVGVVSSVNLIKSNGAVAQAVWTTDGSTPSYTVPSGAVQYETLAGGLVTGLGATVVIGANPILFENK